MKIGWISLHRKILNHWIFKDSKVKSKFEAWCIILLEANHSDEKVLIGDELIECKRGQSINSQKTWAKLFGWDRSRVRRFFNLLQSDSMIELKTTNKTTILTICNYDGYQTVKPSNEHQMNIKRTSSEHQMNTNNNDNNENNENKIQFDKFWNHYHEVTKLNKTDKESAFKYFKKLSLDEKRLAYKNAKPYFESLKDKKYCKKARTYLSDKNFNDEFTTEQDQSMYSVWWYQEQIRRDKKLNKGLKVDVYKRECLERNGVNI